MAAPDPDRAPENAFVRYRARILDPTTAGRLPDGRAPQQTAYVADRLLITAASQQEAIALLADLDEALAGSGYRRRTRDPFGSDAAAAEPADGSAAAEQRAERDADRGSAAAANAADRRSELLRAAVTAGVPVAFTVEVDLPTAAADEPPAPVDVWPLLRRIRQRGTDVRRGDGERATGVIGLDHLMFASPAILGNPAHPVANAVVYGDPAHPVANGVDGSYPQPGSGGRGPVAVVLPAPQPGRRSDRKPSGRAPHVVVLDTGVGAHDWFAPPQRPVHRDLTFGSGFHVAVDVADPEAIRTDPEGAGAIPDRMTGQLASHAGHGTFISGLLRQGCPEAEISTLRVMGADGIVPESELATAILGLSVRQHDGGPAHEPGSADALVLSLGYYAEIDDASYTAGLAGQLRWLARHGVRVYAAAGNDCTERRCYPAGFADASDFADLDHPLRAVAALNPDGATVAMFSNDGDWVNGHALGANLVSTMPSFPPAAAQSAVRSIGPGGSVRAGIDADDYTGGFGVWSGTSFAAAVLAARELSARFAEVGEAH